jgi:hypothetical protein
VKTFEWEQKNLKGDFISRSEVVKASHYCIIFQLKAIFSLISYCNLVGSVNIERLWKSDGNEACAYRWKEREIVLIDYSMIYITTHIAVILNVNGTYPGETNCSNAVRKHVA